MIKNLIWLLKSQYEIDFSFNWINEIFSNCISYYDINNNFNIFKDNSIIIVCVGKEPNPKLIKYIEKYNELNYTYKILHLSDEAFEQNIDFYNVSKSILRNYYNPIYSNKYNVKTIPLGYQSGIKYIESKKEYIFNFIGQIKSDRYQMLNQFNNIKPNFIYTTNMWNDPNGLNPIQYSEILSKSYFTLCPRGWVSLDSFRINEALECNSIPISILDKDGIDYFKFIYCEHPFIIGKDWNDALNKMLSCNKEDKLNEIKMWWHNFKQNLYIELCNI